MFDGIRNGILAFQSMVLMTLAASPAAAATATIDLTIRADGDSVHVVYTLPRPTTSLPLRLADSPAPAADVRIRERGLALQDGRITGTRPFSRATLIVQADSRERDGVYPLARPVQGRGLVLYAPYILPKDLRSRVRISGAGRRGAPLREPERNGYVVVGASPERHRGFRFLAGRGISASFRQTLLERASRILSYYGAKLGRAPEQEPLIILTEHELLPGMSQSLLRGDVSANGVVFLRSYSGGAGADAAPSPAQYTGFLAHELFHLWNRSGDAATRNWWLFEGGAEYAGWLAAATLWPNEHRLEQRVGSALTTCMMYLGSQPIEDLDEHQSRGVRYPCGAVIQWVADVGTRAQSPERDGLAIWRDLLASKAQRGSYGPRDFATAVSRHAPGVAPVIEALVSGAGIERWEALAASLGGFGAELRVKPPAPFSLRLAAAKSLVLSACREIHGVGEDGRGLFVQAPQACSVFGDSPVIEDAAGASALQDPSGFYVAVLESCRRRTSVPVTLRGERGRRTEHVRCDIAVDPPPPEIEVVRALPVRGG